MSPSWIRRRDNKTGRTYQVLYRRGGRAYAIETAGTFATEREAKLRRDLVAGWLAMGLNPRVELERLLAAPPAPRTVRQGIAAFRASRVDVAKGSGNVIRHALNRLDDQLGDRDPATLTVADVQEAIQALELAPSSVQVYVTYWRALLDFIEVDPNPARSKHLRLPRAVREEINPPTADHFLAALSIVPPRLRLPLVTLEQTGMRVGELEALTWGDIDEPGGQFRLRTATTKTRRPRWVQVPDWVMRLVSESLPVDDRSPERRVFTGFTQQAARRALRSACTTAGVPHFTPHDLRHRRATIWHHSGLPVRVLMERGGWATSEIPIEVYSHMMPLDEAPLELLERLLVMPR